ncbi:phosphomethylpyrimidine kinase [Chthonomonas calidirosea]|uniref:Hydroxymethylpyrimidine kinase/phosphomethylpyrimidine kinase n=1 Tax=Chthonomonas calidirosea (strain DSM 23976 / ICMP 18418 / T49) TaxID=1303518 RepID=S0EYK2_CHTCT|nr:bifunctional hydroxymethylpyrimidine kinase/phosphomethylpyrimidine kinase [Chthonomonas calidirosea]CCW35463.1 hydroxymethylpyrimidine kinase/phosphomethylpyrimidine kinase [Chthonomonas calidirosea T49]CEK20202.1 phosphomethylpyrimidine kinase [Chthonomonas calidirosea]
MPVPSALTIAGSDSGGGAGLQADLKTFERYGVYGMSAVTLITAQNRRHIKEVFLLPPDLVTAQIECAWEEVPPRAIKIGALGNRAIVEAVVRALRRPDLPPLVVDPVVVSSSGKRLLESDGLEVLITQLFPMATLITPNLLEAEVLLKGAIAADDEKQMQEAVYALKRLGPQAVLLKGGHGVGPEAVDFLFDGQTCHRLALPRLTGTTLHGSGCQLSAAIAARLALGDSLRAAVEEAKRYVFYQMEKALFSTASALDSD